MTIVLDLFLFIHKSTSSRKALYFSLSPNWLLVNDRERHPTVPYIFLAMEFNNKKVNSVFIGRHPILTSRCQLLYSKSKLPFFSEYNEIVLP